MPSLQVVVLGRFTAPYGVKGWLHLHPFGDDPASWKRMAHWWLAHEDTPGAQWTAHEVDGLRQHGGSWVVKLNGVDTREASEALTGWFFGAPKEALPKPKEGEYYWADLIGLGAVNLQGVSLGVVDALIATGANDVLKLRDGEHERLLPFVEQVVKEVDIPASRVLVDWQADW